MSYYEYPNCLICLDNNFITHRSLTLRSLCSMILPPLITHPENMTFSFISKHRPFTRSWPGCWNFFTVHSVPISQKYLDTRNILKSKGSWILKRISVDTLDFLWRSVYTIYIYYCTENAVLCNMQDSSGNKMCLHWVGVHCLVLLSFSNLSGPAVRSFSEKSFSGFWHIVAYTHIHM